MFRSEDYFFFFFFLKKSTWFYRILFSGPLLLIMVRLKISWLRLESIATLFSLIYIETIF